MKLFRYMNLRYDSLKNLLVFIIAVIMLQSFSTAQSLDSLIEEAITNNPQLKSQQFKIKASEFRAESINNYPAPNASLEFSQVPITNPIFPTQALSINLGLSQMFPLGDKLGAMTEVERRNTKIEGTVTPSIKWILSEK